MRVTLGQAPATCPSQEQFEGIVDLNDPCQSGFSTLPLSTNPVIAINPLTGSTIAAPTTSAPTASSSATPWIIGGVAVLALLLMMGARR